MSCSNGISALSTEYILVPVEGTDDNGVIDPTSLVVEMAIVPFEVAPSLLTTWFTAEWITVSQDNLDDIYKARLLVGPGGVITLTVGSWDVWVRVTHVTETPMEKAGTILVV